MKLGGEVVAAVGPHLPTGSLVVPLEMGDLGLEERVVVEPEVLGDPLAVLEDLGTTRVLLRRHVARLLEERHVHHRRRVALGAGIPVPVPGAPDIAALVDDPHATDAGLDQPRRRQQASEARPDHRDRHVVGHGVAGQQRRVGVGSVGREPPGQALVLLVAIRPEALGPLEAVLLAECLSVHGERRLSFVHG